MPDDAYMRHLGAAHRQQVAAFYHNRGNPREGLRMARRYIEETAAEVCEANGREAAYRMIMGVGDRIVANRLLNTDTPLPGLLGFQAEPDEEELLPGPKAAIARLVEQEFCVDAKVTVSVAGPAGLDHAIPALKKWIRDEDKRRLAAIPGWRGVLRRNRPGPFVCGMWLGMAFTAWLLWPSR